MLTYDGLSSFEKECAEELYKRLKGLIPVSKYAGSNPKLTMWRFLKARNFDLDKAEQMYRKSYIWRQSYQINSILEDFKPKEFFLKHIMPTELGFDKDGHIVCYFPVGAVESKDILKCDTMNNFLRHWMWYGEWIADRCRQYKERTGKPDYVNRSVLIVDLDKLTLSNVTSKHSIEITLRHMGFLSDNYPEFLKAMYAINAPAYYVLSFPLLKAVMSQEMLQKIHIYGYGGWKEKLVKDIDADILPAFLGGNRTDPDGNPLCRSIIRDTDSKISEVYYMSDKDRRFKDETRVKKVKISAKGKEEICIDVAENGSKIMWEFFLDKDIGFGLFCKSPEDPTPKEILPVQKYDTFGGPEVGWYRTRCTGKYIITFDNSHSWMTSKEVRYCITLINPDSS